MEEQSAREEEEMRVCNCCGVNIYKCIRRPPIKLKGENVGDTKKKASKLRSFYIFVSSPSYFNILDHSKDRSGISYIFQSDRIDRLPQV